MKQNVNFLQIQENAAPAQETRAGRGGKTAQRKGHRPENKKAKN
jgi:hypothetical protein